MWQPQRTYNEYVLRTPALLVGAEAVRGLYHYPLARIAVIHGTSFQDRELMEAVFKKKEIRFLLRSWKGEPDLPGLSGTLHELEEFRPDTIIAAGGGSVMDGAKLCRLLYEFPFFEPGKTKLDGVLFQTKFIVLPTTVGSGAEVSSAAVYAAHNRKNMVVLHELLPDVVVYDRRYVEETPLRLLAASVMDAMAHVLEGAVSDIPNTMMEIKAEEALRLICVELKNMCGKEPADYQRLQYAGFLGGMIQNHCIVGAAHAVAHQVTQYGFSHGEAVALLLPAVIRRNMKDKAAEKKYECISVGAGLEGIEEVIGLAGQMCDISGISDRKEELKKILETRLSDSIFFDNVRQDRAGKGNPVEITEDYIVELIRSM